jgi:PadR family transcriptional regulator, regulatory protein PadR
MAGNSPGPRMTQTTQKVLRALLERPTHELYGLEICAKAGLPSGTIHPILARLEKAEWLESRWEDTDPREMGRPRRRYYRFSPDGAERARIALARVSESTAALRQLRPSMPVGGVA